jgi:hypothetical protein
MGEVRNVHNIFVGMNEGKRPLGRPRHRWKDIRMVLREIGWEGMDWIHLAQDGDNRQAAVNTVTNLQVKRWGIS